MTIDPSLREPDRHALALVRAYVMRDDQAWQALNQESSTLEMAVVAEALCRVASVLAVMERDLPEREPASEPDRLDAVLTEVSGALLRSPPLRREEP